MAKPVPAGRLRRAALRFERHAHPLLLLTAVTWALYLPTLAIPFFIDDYRAVRLMREFQSGERRQLDLYRFFDAAFPFEAERRAGRLPWWISDDLRFSYFRPVAEWSLYADWLLWGDRPAGFHLTNLLLYTAAVWLVLWLYRAVQPDEARARWAALLFALASCHAVPMIMVAARCDLLALPLSIAAMLSAVRFSRNGQASWLLLALATLTGALLSKESAAPAAAGFVVVWLAARGMTPAARRRPGDRRAALAFAAMLAVTGGWLAVRTSQNCDITIPLVIHPFERPFEYLAAAPGRALQFMSAWLLSVNPAMFYYHSSGEGPQRWFMVIGAVGLSFVALLFATRHRRDVAVMAFAAWALAYVPIVACVLPDERLLTMPSVGLAFLAAAWLRAPRRAGSWVGAIALRAVPTGLFVVVPPLVVLATTAAVGALESRAAQDLRSLGATMRAAPPGAVALAVNAHQMLHAIWATDRARYVLGPDGPALTFLCDLPDVDGDVLDERTLRLTAVHERFLSTLLGRFGQSVNDRLQTGDEFLAAGFLVTIREMADGAPTTIDLRFDRPLASDDVWLFHLTNEAAPARWRPVVGERRRFGAFQKDSGPRPPATRRAGPTP